MLNDDIYKRAIKVNSYQSRLMFTNLIESCAYIITKFVFRNEWYLPVWLSLTLILYDGHFVACAHAYMLKT